MTDDRSTTELKDALLDAALPHVAFDGWTPATFRLAVDEAGIERAVADAICPRGAVDLALAFHARGDAAMVQRLREAELGALRFRDRVALAVRFRLEAVAEDKEAVRRGTTLFSLPHLAPDGARAIWGTADAIWTALGDKSDDFNWYSKRATLSGVYGSTVLYWLGDESEGAADTWAFLDRRIDDVMQIEKAKKTVNDHPVLGKLAAGPNWLLSQVKAPMKDRKADMPGSWRTASSS